MPNRVVSHILKEQAVQKVFSVDFLQNIMDCLEKLATWLVMFCNTEV